MTAIWTQVLMIASQAPYHRSIPLTPRKSSNEDGKSPAYNSK